MAIKEEARNAAGKGADAAKWAGQEAKNETDNAADEVINYY